MASYGTVAEADAALGYVPAWTALPDDAAKQRRLDSARLWLGAMYVLPATPTADELVSLKEAEQEAARVSLTVPLFAEPGGAAAGSVVTLTRKKVEGLETEERYLTPETVASDDGPISIPKATAILALAGIDPIQSTTLSSAVFVV